jgi:hypothetical protein
VAFSAGRSQSAMLQAQRSMSSRSDSTLQPPSLAGSSSGLLRPLAASSEHRARISGLCSQSSSTGGPACRPTPETTLHPLPGSTRIGWNIIQRASDVPRDAYKQPCRMPRRRRRSTRPPSSNSCCAMCGLPFSLQRHISALYSLMVSSRSPEYSILANLW